MASAVAETAEGGSAGAVTSGWDEPRRTILVVDDSDRIREVTAAMLRDAGFEVIEAATGEEALTLLERQPDLVILDVHLPDIDGLEVCRRIKSQGVTASVPVLYLSGTSRESQDRVRGLETGADGYLTKPVGAAELTATVNALLRARDAQLRERLQETETLLAVGQILALELPTREAMRRVAREIGRAFAAGMVGAYFLTPAKDALVPLAGYHVPKELLPTFLETPFSLARFAFVQEARRTGRPLWSGDALCDPRFDPALIAAIRPRTVVFAPTLVRQEIVGGLLLVWWTPNRAVTPAGFRLIEGVANQVGLALERADLARQTEARQAMQFAVTRVLVEASTLADATPRVLQAICEGSGWDLGEVWHVDPAAHCLRWAGMWHVPTVDPAGLGVDETTTRAPGQGLSGHVWAGDHPLWIPDAVAEDPRVVRTRGLVRAGVRSAFAFPIHSGDDVTGVVMLFGRHPRPADEDLLRIMTDLGTQIGQFIVSKRAEDDRQRLEGQLRQAQKMEAVGRLAGGVAHDFNNLLTVILGRSDLLCTGLPPDQPLQRHARLILETAHRATDLTQQLLAFSRKQVLQPRVLSLNRIVTGMETMLRRLIGEHIELKSGLDPALDAARADSVQLEQVILNLAVNARDAMPRGGWLTIETANVELDEAFVSCHPGAHPGSYVMLAMTDTGVGMDAETLGHIFEPFFTTKGPGRGTGLGLATVYGIVKQHGGYIAVESEPGRGTIFRIYLPRVAGVAEPVEARLDPVVPAGGSETVLVVEDEAGPRDVARETLERYGYRVLEAGHPDEALQLLAQHGNPIHLMVADVVMPRMSGPELAERLRSLRPAMKVLFISGYTDNPALQGILDAGTPFLQKPFTPVALAGKVRQVLDPPGRDEAPMPASSPTAP